MKPFADRCWKVEQALSASRQHSIQIIKRKEETTLIRCMECRSYLRTKDIDIEVLAQYALATVVHKEVINEHFNELFTVLP